ncbi:acetolactate decarboxylase [Polaribacter sp. P097]|uniref:acetolactate decarboxylase n=1 Tax=Polaribacter sp. P097 TaxID=3117398 RepID=UPI002FE1889B
MNRIKTFPVLILLIIISSCKPSVKTENEFYIVGQMKDVMWKGKLGPSIQLDTIKNTQGLYGLGPVSYLSGELLINDGQTYVSRVTSDTTMSVEKNNTISAPFFVYSNVKDWKIVDLPIEIQSIVQLQNFITDNSKDLNKPFAFKLKGKVSKATIHIQNLPKGSKVSSPKEAHQGQVNYKIFDEDCTIVGFYSENHQGIFTHHDSYLHMHLITDDEQKLGHLDDVKFDKIQLYLPKN